MTRRLKPEDVAVNQFIGSRVAFRRYEKEVVQSDLATTLSITTQMLSKYERGESTISAARIWQIATELRTPVAFFFEGLDSGGEDDEMPRELLTDTNIQVLRRYMALDSEEQIALFRILDVMTRGRRLE